MDSASPPHCERLSQGVARLSAFRLPPRPRRSDGLLLPLSAEQLHLVGPQPPDNMANGTGRMEPQRDAKSPRPLSASSACLPRLSPQAPPVLGPGGRRLHSLDSAAHLAVSPGDQRHWLNTQKALAAEAAELRRRREQSCCASVLASYAFLALSVALSLSVVIAVCMFLHSFVPKEFNGQNEQIIAGKMDTFSPNAPKMLSQLLGQQTDDQNDPADIEFEMELFDRKRRRRRR